MEKAELQYRLRAGALLQDVVNFDSSKMMSNKNISRELSLYHLSTNPNCKKYFDKLLENWEAEVEAYKASFDDEAVKAAEEAKAKEAAEERERLEREAAEAKAAEEAAMIVEINKLPAAEVIELINKAATLEELTPYKADTQRNGKKSLYDPKGRT